MSSSSGAGEPPVVRVEIPSGRGVQVGDHNTQDITFVETYIAQQQVIQSPSGAESGPVVAGEVPQLPAAFQPRAELLEALEAGGPGVPVVRAVTGMRGVGKSQVAAAYARSCIDAGWRLVAWVNAGDTAKVLNGLAVMAVRLGIGEPGASLEEIGALVRNRLEGDGDRCLVVFDNVTDLGGLRPFLPAAGKAQVVITSTGLGAESLGTPVPVGVFTEAEALGFLAQRVGRADADVAAEVARELGYLPLALAQAAAVIAAQRLGYRTYLDRLRSVPVREYLLPADGEPYPQGVAEAVLLALDSVVGDVMGLCGVLVDLVSLLSGAGVSRALLYAAGPAGALRGPGTQRWRGRRRRGRDGGFTPQQIDEALDRLVGASLLTFSGDGSTVLAHRLIMRVARERRAQDGSLAALGSRTWELLSAVTESLDEPWRNQLAARDMIQQVIALNEHLAPYLRSDHVELAEKLLRAREWALSCMNTLGDSAVQAVEYGVPLAADFERFFGDAHPDTLAVRSNLAVAYQDAGRLDQAVQLMERTLSEWERILGDTDPHTLAARSNLASAYRDAGRLDRAIPLMERTLTDREQVLGGTHPDTLTSRSNLASAYQAAGRLDQAIPLLESTLTDRERVLDDTHPDMLISRNNLAEAYREAGRLDQAIPLLERTLTDSERILGGTHPRTLTARNNLALAYQGNGRLDQAIPLFERTLTDSEHLHGSTHPRTLTARNNLALAYQRNGRLDQAIPLFERALTDRERVLGDTHPHTLATRYSLALVYRDAGRLDQAIPLYERNLANCERVLGDTHPHTLISRNNLATAYRGAGRLDQAIPLLERTVADSRRVLGDSHPSTLAAQSNLALAYQAAEG